MKKFPFLLLLLLQFSCNNNDDDRIELSGNPTSITGNVKDYHRDININDFEIKLVKTWVCSNGNIFSTKTCEKEIAMAYADNDGNYSINFEYNLRDDETYWIYFNESKVNPYIIEFVSSDGEIINYYNTSNIIQGQENILNINAWIPIKIKFNLTVLNNHTPPLITGIKDNGKVKFGTKRTNEGEEFKTFEMIARPNSEIEILFWYIENYNSKNPIFHNAPTIPFVTDESEVTELDFEIDCNNF